jgi:hypothetical protein
MTGPGPNDSAVVVWKDKIPVKVALPPPSDAANRQLATPQAIDNGRTLLVLSELTPANQQTPGKYHLLNGGSAAETPPLQPGRAISAVYFYHYAASNNAGETAGHAMVLQAIPVDQLSRVVGINQKGEVFDRSDSSFFVWRNGQVNLLPASLASTLVIATSWNNKGQTCASVRVFLNTPNIVHENAITSLGTAGKARVSQKNQGDRLPCPHDL